MVRQEVEGKPALRCLLRRTLARGAVMISVEADADGGQDGKKFLSQRSVNEMFRVGE
jgi:hypothetical protein